MNTKQLIAKEVEKNTIKIMKLFNAGVPFVGLEPSKIKLENRLNQFATNIAKAVLADVREKAECVRLDVDVIVCDCGEKYRDSDLDISTAELLDHITKREKELTT